VATIKPATPDRPGKGFMVRGRQFSTVNTTLNDLISFAYGVHAKQITGGTGLDGNRKVRESPRSRMGRASPTISSGRAWFKSCWRIVFKLTFHRDKKELAVYAIAWERTDRAHEERRQSQRPTRPVLPGARSIACHQRDHGGFRPRGCKPPFSIARWWIIRDSPEGGTSI